MFTEFFCGIGGLAMCLPPNDDAVSIDINRNALAVHELNCTGNQICKAIESLKPDELGGVPTKLWWMSPPCQPFTRRGLQRDLEDSRSAGFRNVIGLLRKLQPENLGIENVPEFLGSASHQLLRAALVDCGYSFVERVFCATELGTCNRRKRYYLAASRTEAITELPLPAPMPVRIPVRVQSDVETGIYSIPPDWLANYGNAIHVVEEASLKSGDATTRCFTSAYGRSPVRSGSYLKTYNEIRHFTPLEILWQLGFPSSFQLPDWTPEKLWPLTGNTLALPAVRFILSHLPIQLAVPNSSP